MQPVIAIHGGAGDIPDDLVAGHERGVRRAAEIGLEILQREGSAEDAVEAAIRYLEDDETFDAGRGSFLNQDGEIELDAAFMEGRMLEAGAIAGVRDIANPISLARLVMGSEQVFFVGEGASRFAEQHGMQRCTRERLLVPRELELWEKLKGTVKGDTVGAVALDYRGHLAAGTSTGGRPFKLPGRVGDVPCIGSGLYVDDQLGATSSTGEGELIMRVVMAKWAVDHLAGGRDPQRVAQDTIQHLYARVKGEAGLILIDRLGRVGCHFNTRRMSRAWSIGAQIYAQVEQPT
jgi:beta-aspartyl-peptidase (threonine type)